MKTRNTIAVSICLGLLMCQPMTALGHEHVFTEWSADRNNHYYICECGEKADIDAHVLDDVNLCEVCGMTVFDLGDGTYSIMCYDEQGSVKSQTDYDADGNVLGEMLYECEYFEDGNPSHTWEYKDGVLIYESIYLPIESEETEEFSEVYLSEDIYYSEDTTTISKYDDRWNLISCIQYDSDDNIVFEDTYEYVYDEDDNLIHQICYSNGEKSYEIYYEVHEEGWSYAVHEIFYDEEGQIVQEFRYDADGNEITE